MAKKLSPIKIYFLLAAVALLHVLNRAQPAQAKLNKTEFISQFLEGHNAARKAVGVAPLKWNNLLTQYARVYSSTLRRHDCKLIHSNSLFGENLFWGQGKSWQPKDAVAAWVDEKKWYDYSHNSCSSGKQCGHYTQVVWNETRTVGCSKIVCDSGDTLFTCEYHPAGNYEGEKPY